MLQIVQTTQPTIPTLALRALSPIELPDFILHLSDAIVAHGGWILERSTSDTGDTSVVFEFECGACLDMYGAMVASGLAVSRAGHMQMTQLWQCSRHRDDCPSLHIARVALTVFAPGQQPRRQTRIR